MVHGIIAIHGIGEGQRRGEFLAELVNAVADFLEEAGGKVERRFQVGERATAYLRVTAPEGVEEFEFVEAYWADAFPPPRATAVLGWLWPQVRAQVSLLWAGLRDAANDATFDPTGRGAPAVRNHTPTFSWGTRLAHVAWLVTLAILLLVAGVVFLPVLALLQVLMLLPLPSALGPMGLLGKTIAPVLAIEPFLIRVVGDTYRYVNDGAWAANIRGIVERCLVEMVVRPEVSDITIVAHSQGCAIAYDALAEGSPVGQALRLHPKRLTLVTLGSGINRIFALAHNSSSYARRRFSLPLDSAVRGAGQVLALEDLRRRFYWVDLYARLDPVPAGPVSDSILRQAGLDPGQVKRRRVINTDNPVSDHSLCSYLGNRDLVLPRVVRALYGGDDRWKEVTSVRPEQVRWRTRAVAFIHLPWVIWVWGVMALALILVFWEGGREGLVGAVGPKVQALPGLGQVLERLKTESLQAAFAAVLVAGALGGVAILVSQVLRMTVARGRL
ncbi:MAG: hypothetical protein NZ951_01040 [Dehalococcoidia bacterium]|nr:hypothetical protein [Dehalococcoidia bacterium]MDW8119227.1 hypothetical protein [Chloroflexota bacterium]